MTKFNFCIAFCLSSLAFAAESPLFDESTLDRSVGPCDDFYQFACGNWIAKTEIPPDRSGWSRAFDEIHLRNQNVLREILEQFAAGKTNASDPLTLKLGNYYATCADEKRAETASLKTLKEELSEIEKIKDLKTLAEGMGALHLASVNAFFRVEAFQDYRDSEQMVGGLDQGGLGLPDREYYLSDDAKKTEIRKQYEAHVSKSLQLLGVSKKTASQNAATIVRIETSLARSSQSRTERRDPYNIYHRLEREGVVKTAPHFAWDAYLSSLGYPTLKAINVSSAPFFEAVDKIVVENSIADLRTYLKWHLLERSFNALGKRFVDERFSFTSTAFGGEKEIKPRWKRCVEATEQAMGQPLGRSFVKVAFGEDGKTSIRELITSIEEVFETSLKKLSWMDDATRKQALLKVATIVNQAGYPDRWRDFTTLAVTKESYLRNALAASQFNMRFTLDKMEKPVDRMEWHMPPQAVNAYYSPENNQMVFPAGILQSPFFDPKGPIAVNYGGIGMVMGHELTHGYDDEGKKFDSKGNLNDWWTETVAKEFKERSDCMVKQYSGYTVLGDTPLNGKLTLGENIADQGGAKFAYQAYKKRAGREVAASGFSPDQQFFIAVGQTWCAKRRPQAERLLVTIDPHSPPKYRVNGSLSNLPEFAEAFSCKKGSPMAPEKSCAVW